MKKQTNAEYVFSFKNLIPLILVNIIILIWASIFCFDYTKKSYDTALTSELNAFSATVDTMEKTAYGYLKSHQVICNNWAKHINDNSMTVEDALDFLKSANSEAGVMAHIVSLKDKTGYSTADNVLTGNNHVDYSALHGVKFESDEIYESDTPILISNRYTNPTDALPVVGFGQRIKLVDGEENEENSNNGYNYYLIRVVKESMLTDILVFPDKFKKAELAIIQSSSGNYIMASSSFRNANFWEFLRIYNKDLGYQGRDELAEDMKNNGTIYQGTYDNKDDRAYFVCKMAKTVGDWSFIGLLPVSSISVSGADLTVAIFVAIIFILLLLINGGYILTINKKLKASVEKARQADLAKTRFLSSMSHDIRTPMNAIIGLTTIASKHVDDPEQINDYLGKISLASNHLLTLINDVLDISKIESGKMSLSPVVFSLSQTMDNLVNITRPNIKEKGLKFEIHTYGIEHEYLFADEVRINQIFINILSNAVKYTKEGGKVTLSLTEEKVAGDSNCVLLTYCVEDTGIGMSEEFQKVMYDTFSRAVDSRIDKIQGTGLGLAIVKQMVDIMKGTIDCESKLGVGTKFTVKLTIPIAEKLTDDLALPPMEMLVVDDDEIFLKTARDTLESLNLKVDVANSGTEAVKMIAEKHALGKDYPAVIIDWIMPGMDGVTTTRKIRTEIGANIPIIIISSYDWSDIEQEALDAGANAFINKPLFKSTAYNKINELLNLRNENNLNSQTENSSVANLNLLIAEDNDLNWEIICELLGFYGIRTHRAVNGKDCVEQIEKAERGQYDAVLMDIQMPIMNGIEACIKIKALEDSEKRNIPVIAMTANAFAEDIKACLDAGMCGHVAKPVDMSRLMSEFEKAGLMRK